MDTQKEMAEHRNVPLYDRIKKRIAEDCASLPYYTAIPSEREFCQRYEVSRPTVRTALKQLEEDGILVRLPRKGTFYVGNKPHVDHQLASATGFFNDVRLQGRTTTSKVLFQNVVPATKKIAGLLGVQEGELVYRLERLRYLDGQIYSLSDSYLPISYLPLVGKVDFTTHSLYDTLSRQGVVPYMGRQQLTFRPADAYESMHLEIEEGTPLSVMGSRMYTEEGNLIEYAEVKTPAYRTSYEMVVYRENHKEEPRL